MQNLAKTLLQAVYKVEWRDWTSILAGIVVCGDAWLLWAFLFVRTDEALVSPWLVLGFVPFVVYAATTWALLLCAAYRRDSLSLALSVLHFFTSFSVATIVYAIGFGFDPFIHRAAETALFETGSIEPKRFLYSGQYYLVAGLAHLTRLSVSTIDRWLVPVLASLAVPLSAYFGLRRGWGLDGQAARLWLHVTLLIPYLPLVFTVPHNIAVVLAIAVFFLLPVRNANASFDFVLFAIAVYAPLVHPLLGVPLALFIAFFVWWGRTAGHPWLRFSGAVAYTTLSIIAIPILFGVLNLQSGGTTFSLSQAVSRIDYFTGLFRDPYVTGSSVTAVWNWLYAYRTYVPGLLLIGAFAYAFYARRRMPAHTTVPYALFLASNVVMLFFASTLFVFKDIIGSEQMEFALRLVQAFYFVAAPLAAVMLASAWYSRVLKSFGAQCLFLLVLACGMTASWHFSYPQWNVKAMNTGPSVSWADVEAVRLIEARNAGRDYFVLANQMTAAAALQEFGFAHYLSTPSGQVLWYPLPTGGELYRFYSHMTSVEPSRETMEQASAFTGTKRGYFLAYDYWPYAEWIMAKAAAGADNVIVIGERNVIIFEYDFN